MEDVRNNHTADATSMDFFEETFDTPAKRVAFLASDRGVTQVQLAKELDRSRSFISQVFSGSKGMPVEDWLRVAVYFGVTLDWLQCRPGAPMYAPKPDAEEPNYASKFADEAAALIDSMPPRKREEMLSVLRAMAFSVRKSEEDVEETVKRLSGTLAISNLSLSPTTVERIRAILLTFVLGLATEGD
jgi:transcriptional regulator with XRE-family HTH domain